MNRHSDVLHCYRSRLFARTGAFDAALDDASRALEINPSSPRNFLAQAHALQRVGRLREAGSSYLVGLRPMSVMGEEPGEGRRYVELLGKLRRQRSFFAGAEGQRALFPQPEEGGTFLEKGGLVGSPGNSRHAPNIFDPRRLFDDGERAPSQPPEPPLLALRSVGKEHAEVCWEDPEDFGEPIFKHTLQMARFECVWDDKQTKIFEGFRDFEEAYQLRVPRRAGVSRPGDSRPLRTARLDELSPDTLLRFRARVESGAGRSGWSEVLEATTLKAPLVETPVDDMLPASWLVHLDVGDLVREEGVRQPQRQCAPVGFFRDLAAVLLPRARALKSVFRKYSGDGKMGAKEFRELAKEMRISRDTGVPGMQPLQEVGVDLLFQRANVKGLVKRSTAAEDGAEGGPLLNRPELQQLAEEALRERWSSVEDDVEWNALELYASANGRPKPAEGSFERSDGSCECHEWVGALLRLAWQTFAPLEGGGSTAAQRLEALLERCLLPACAAFLDKEDPFKAVFLSRRVQAVTSFYRPRLEQIFNSYAAADAEEGVMDSSSLESMNLKELIFMMKEGQLIDSDLSLPQVMSIFGDVNEGFAGAGEDDDDQELCFEEFLEVLARICDSKIPEERRGGEPFELTFQSWLALLILPKYKVILKEKDRGVGSKTL